MVARAVVVAVAAVVPGLGATDVSAVVVAAATPVIAVPTVSAATVVVTT
jgi:hypothetical protein